MKILTGPWCKFRFEYRLEAAPPNQHLLQRRVWRLFLDGVLERVDARYFEAVRPLLPKGHPAHAAARHIYGPYSDDRFAEVLPFRPFVPYKSLVAIMGAHFIERVVQSPREMKVWSSEDGWTWMHIPGDAIS